MRAPLNRLLLLLALGAGLFAPAARAATVPPPLSPARVETGRVYVTPVPALPADVREVELFLAPGDGSGRLIRLTAEHHARDGSLRWRMPAIATARARLVLRAGADGHEWESEPSPAFEVAAPGRDELARLLSGESESGWQLPRPEPEAGGVLVPADATTISLARMVARAAEESHAPGVEVPLASAIRTLRRTTSVRPHTSAVPLSSLPTFRPLLI